MKRFLYILCFVSVLFMSCKKEEENSVGIKKVALEEIASLKQNVIKGPGSFEKLMEYYKLYKDHFVYKKNIENFDFEVIYNTHFSLAVNDLDTMIYTKNKNSLTDELKKFDKLHYFTFRISNRTIHTELLKYDIKSEKSYTDRILYYMNNCQSEFLLIEDGDTLRSPFVNFERTFDLAPVITLTVVFERKKDLNFKNLDFIFDDKIFNNGKIKFQLEPEIISVFNNPEIKKYNL